MGNVAAYIRVSTSEQNTDNQLPAIEAYCDNRGWIAVKQSRCLRCDGRIVLDEGELVCLLCGCRVDVPGHAWTYPCLAGVEIATEIGCDEKTITNVISDKTASLPENLKSLASHAVDFEIPLY